MLTFPRYESYKDSGVEWLGEIPSYWEIKRLKFLVQIKTGEKDTVNRVEDGKYPFFIRSPKVQKIDTYSYDEEAVLTAGDGDIGRIFHYVHGKFEYHQRVYKFSQFRGVTGKFLYYYFHHHLAEEVIKLSAKSTVDSLRLPMLQNFPVCYPKKQEQKRIVEFLDRSTAEIDRAISQKQRLIELLKEQKAILINQAVTKGLNPNVPMRDSAIEWIGEIPEHWQVCSLGYVARLTAGGTPDRSNAEYWNGNIPWLKTGEINYSEITSSEEFITERGLQNSAAKLALPGTILMAMYGQGVTRGRVAILAIEAAFNQACLAIMPCHKLQTKYLYYYLQSAYGFVRDFGNETSQMNLSSGLISKIKVLVPSHEEQKQVSKFLDQKLIDFDLSIAQQEKIIESLHLLKQVFIANAVTGKIKV